MGDPPVHCYWSCSESDRRMEDTDWEGKLIPKEGHAVLRYDYSTRAEGEAGGERQSEKVHGGPISHLLCPEKEGFILLSIGLLVDPHYQRIE